MLHKACRHYFHIHKLALGAVGPADPEAMPNPTSRLARGLFRLEPDAKLTTPIGSGRDPLANFIRTVGRWAVVHDNNNDLWRRRAHALLDPLPPRDHCPRDHHRWHVDRVRIRKDVDDDDDAMVRWRSRSGIVDATVAREERASIPSPPWRGEEVIEADENVEREEAWREGRRRVSVTILSVAARAGVGARSRSGLLGGEGEDREGDARERVDEGWHGSRQEQSSAM